MTPYQQHLAQWAEGCGSELCAGARKICYARGNLPCKVLFVGEAPGVSENIIGRPFVGPAGHLFDYILQESVPEGVTYALTNLVGCIPLEKDGHKSQTPPDKAIKQCQPRLKDLIRIARPKLIIAVGALARDNLKDMVENLPMADVQHPAYILRSSSAHKGLLIQRCIVNISSAIEQFVLPQA